MVRFDSYPKIGFKYYRMGEAMVFRPNVKRMKKHARTLTNTPTSTQIKLKVHTLPIMFVVFFFSYSPMLGDNLFCQWQSSYRAREFYTLNCKPHCLQMAWGRSSMTIMHARARARLRSCVHRLKKLSLSSNTAIGTAF